MSKKLYEENDIIRAINKIKSKSGNDAPMKVSEMEDRINAIPTGGSGGNSEYAVNYKAFGAVGDGITNDAAAIKACHDYANAHGLPVINSGGLYAVRGYVVDHVDIKTDLIFHDGGFIFDSYQTVGTFFYVPATYEAEQTKTLSQVFTSATEVADQYVGKSFNVTFNNPKMAFAWYADTSDMRSISFPVFASNKNTPFPMQDWDELKNESVTISEIHSMEDRITLSGFTIHYNMEHYLRFVNISRNNVILDRISVTTEGIDGSGLGDIIRINNCANTVIRDCSCEDTDGDSSPQYGYFLQIESCVNTIIDRLHTNMMWAALGTHYINGFTIRDSVTERFDCHFCQYGDVIIDGCTLFEGAEIGYGSGRTRIRDCTLNGSVLYRPDVKGVYNGDIFIENCTSNSTYLLNFWNDALSATVTGYLSTHNGMGDIYVNDTEYNELTNDPWFVGLFNRRGNIIVNGSGGESGDSPTIQRAEGSVSCNVNASGKYREIRIDVGFRPDLIVFTNPSNSGFLGTNVGFAGYDCYNKIAFDFVENLGSQDSDPFYSYYSVGALWNTYADNSAFDIVLYREDNAVIIDKIALTQTNGSEIAYTGNLNWVAYKFT